MSKNLEQVIELGQFSSVFGVKGWIKVKSFTNPRTNIFNYKNWLVKQNNLWTPYQLDTGKPHGKTLVVKLMGLDNREEAQLLVGATIGVYRNELPETADGEYYWSDLLKMQVETTQGKSLGKVVDILETGSNDVLVVRQQQLKGQKKSKDSLIPWLIDDVIHEVNVAEDKIIVDWDPDFIN